MWPTRQGEGLILTWMIYFNGKKTSHYYQDRTKNLTLCNREVYGEFRNSRKRPASENVTKCKTCLRIINTYDNIDNFHPTPKKDFDTYYG